METPIESTTTTIRELAKYRSALRDALEALESADEWLLAMADKDSPHFYPPTRSEPIQAAITLARGMLGVVE